MPVRVALAALALTLAGCSSASSPGAAATGTPTTAPPARGGLVGIIDSARLAAVCANARTAETADAGGLGGTAVEQPLTAAAALLERPPVDPAAVAAAVAIRRALGRGRADLAISAALAFCRAHNS